MEPVFNKFIKKRLKCKICEFSRTPFFTKHLRWLLEFRSSRPDVFYKKGVLKNFAKFTGPLVADFIFQKKHRLKETPIQMLFVNFAKF